MAQERNYTKLFEPIIYWAIILSGCLGLIAEVFRYFDKGRISAAQTVGDLVIIALGIFFLYRFRNKYKKL